MTPEYFINKKLKRVRNKIMELKREEDRIQRRIQAEQKRKTEEEIRLDFQDAMDTVSKELLHGTYSGNVLYL